MTPVTQPRVGGRRTPSGPRPHPGSPSAPRLPALTPAVVLAFVLAFRDEISSTPRVAAAVASVTLLLVALSVWHMARSRGVTVGLTYILLLGLFHCGLLFSMALTGKVTLFNAYDTTWAHSSVVPDAAWVASVGMASFGAGYSLFARRAREVDRPRTDDADALQTAPIAHGAAIGIVGLGLFLLGLALWLYWTLDSGALAIGGSYVQFLAATGDKPMPYTYVAMGVGLPMTAAAGRGVRRAGLGLFLLWAAPAFLIGLRGEVILPMAAFAVVYARHRRVRVGLLGAVAVALLCLGSFVRGFRVGIGSGFQLSAFNPLDGLSELGYSIRPVVTVIGWTQTGEPFMGTDTYLNPVKRLIDVLVPVSAPAAGDDPAALSTAVLSRIGPIGGSTIAEAYRSDGVVAVVVVMALIGVLCRVLDRLPTSAVLDSLVGGTAFVLFLWIRNDVIPVPFQMLVVLLVVWLVSLVPGASDRQSPGRRGRPALRKQPTG